MTQKLFVFNELLDDPRRWVFTHITAQQDALVAFDSRLDERILPENYASHMCGLGGIETMDVKPNFLDVHFQFSVCYPDLHISYSD
jgi:hypothetical protein